MLVSHFSTQDHIIVGTSGYADHQVRQPCEHDLPSGWKYVRVSNSIDSDDDDDDYNDDDYGDNDDHVMVMMITMRMMVILSDDDDDCDANDVTIQALD